MLLHIMDCQRPPAPPLDGEEVLLVARLVPGSLPDASAPGPRLSPPHRLLVLLEAECVGQPHRVVLDLLRGQTDPHGDDGQSCQAVQGSEGHLQDLQIFMICLLYHGVYQGQDLLYGEVALKARAWSVVTEAYCCKSDPGEVHGGHNVPVLLPLAEHGGPSEDVEAHDHDSHRHGDGDIIGWHVVLERGDMTYELQPSL